MNQDDFRSHVIFDVLRNMLKTYHCHQKNPLTFDYYNVSKNKIIFLFDGKDTQTDTQTDGKNIIYKVKVDGAKYYIDLYPGCIVNHIDVDVSNISSIEISTICSPVHKLDSNTLRLKEHIGGISISDLLSISKDNPLFKSKYSYRITIELKEDLKEDFNLSLDIHGSTTIDKLIYRSSMCLDEKIDIIAGGMLSMMKRHGASSQTLFKGSETSSQNIIDQLEMIKGKSLSLCSPYRTPSIHYTSCKMSDKPFLSNIMGIYIYVTDHTNNILDFYEHYKDLTFYIEGYVFHIQADKSIKYGNVRFISFARNFKGQPWLVNDWHSNIGDEDIPAFSNAMINFDQPKDQKEGHQFHITYASLNFNLFHDGVVGPLLKI
jgi:hypothetical protein